VILALEEIKSAKLPASSPLAQQLHHRAWRCSRGEFLLLLLKAWPARSPRAKGAAAAAEYAEQRRYWYTMALQDFADYTRSVPVCISHLLVACC
jgi:hypothetical protein